MKIGIITYDEYINIPFIKKYEKILIEKEISYDIVLWNRRGISLEKKENHFVFQGKNYRSKFLKIFSFIQWRNYTLKILKENHYDKLVILTTLPGVLLADYLHRHYVNNYIFDIRDYTYENIKIYQKITHRIQKESGIVLISSEGFRQWISSDVCVFLTHNISNSDEEIETIDGNVADVPIVIGFVGGIRFYKQNCVIVEQLKDKQNIKLFYVGKVHPGNPLEEYCKQRKIENVEFMPAYRDEEKPEIYKSIKFINAVYGADNLVTTTALPNKLYDCILYKKPIIVSKNTYLAEIVGKYNLGFSIDIETEDIYKCLMDYIENFDAPSFLKGCNEYKTKVLEEEQKTKCFINQFFEK